jgi:hypothetical protein
MQGNISASLFHSYVLSKLKDLCIPKTTQRVTLEESQGEVKIAYKDTGFVV